MNELAGNVASKKLTRIQRTWKEQRAYCEEWKASGKTKSQFCRDNGIALPTFCGWCSKVWPVSKDKNQHLSPVRMVNKDEIRQKGERADRTKVEITLPSQAVICLNLSINNIAEFIQVMCHAVAIIR